MATKIQLHQKLHQIKRILIIGDPGSGKNYLGEKIAAHLSLPFKDIDDIIYKRKFDLGRPREERKKLAIFEAKKERWVFAGIPADWARPLVNKAQVIIILREQLVIESFRIIIRFIKRNYFSKKGTKETIKGVFELLKWDYQKFHKKDGDRRILIEEIKKKYANKTYVLPSRKEVNLLLEIMLK